MAPAYSPAGRERGAPAFRSLSPLAERRGSRYRDDDRGRSHRDDRGRYDQMSSGRGGERHSDYSRDRTNGGYERRDEGAHGNERGYGRQEYGRNANGRTAPGEFDSDEDLRGLDFTEYRVKKREKLREKNANSIWKITPSPSPEPEGNRRGLKQPQSPGQDSEGLEDGAKAGKDEKEDGALGKEEGRDKGKASRREKKDEDTGSEEDMESEEDRKGRGRTGKEERRRKKRRKYETESEEESETDSDEESEEDEKPRRKDKRGRSRSEERRSRRRKGRDSRRGKKKRQRRRTPTPSESESESESGLEASPEPEGLPPPQAEAGVSDPLALAGLPPMTAEEEAQFKEYLEKKLEEDNLDNEPIVGPAPAPEADGRVNYGSALRPGEGDAMASYVQQGKRIPRRGEVGLSADEIANFESIGYVMSGSRHQRMNAIRIRKENQVYSAEDKRALAMFNYEEKAKRETKVMADLQRLVQKHVAGEQPVIHHPFAGKQDEE